MTSNISSSSVISAVEGVLGSVTSALSALLFVLVLVIFMGLDGAMFGARMNRVKAGHEPVLGALGQFAQGTRRYFGVATVFGGIVAVLDGIGLLLLGHPGRGPVGAAGVHHQLRAQRRVHHRARSRPP